MAVTDERPVPPLVVERVPVRRLVPMEVVATSLPLLSVLRRLLVRPVNHVVPDVVSCDVDALPLTVKFPPITAFPVV